MKTETIMAKFAIKAINCEPSQGGKSILSAEEQITMVGISWHKSPVGFNILFAQYLNDKSATNAVFAYILVELLERAKKRRIRFSKSNPKLLRIMAWTLTHEILHPYGMKCPKCGGTGRNIDRKNCNNRPCKACDDGFIKWNFDHRYTAVRSIYKVTLSRFKVLHPLYEELIDWLYEQNTRAETLLHKQFSEEVKVG